MRLSNGDTAHNFDWPLTPEPPNFYIFGGLSYPHSGQSQDFKFGMWTEPSKSPPKNDKPSLKWAWSHHITFIHSSGTAVGRWQSFDVPFSLPPALRPRHGSVRNSPLTLGLYYMFIEPSLAGRFLWQGADKRSSYKTADPYHLLSTLAAVTTHQMPPIQVWWPVTV